MSLDKGPSPGVDPEDVKQDLDLASGRERRATPRRGGNPVRVELVDAAGALFAGVVIDRSPSGLGLSLDRPVATGSVLRVRPEQASPQVPWTAVEVRNCTATGPYFEVGCQFPEPPPAAVLRLFG